MKESSTMTKLDTIIRWFFLLMTSAYSVGFWVYAFVADVPAFNSWVALAISWVALMVTMILSQLHARDLADERAKASAREAITKWETREDA